MYHGGMKAEPLEVDEALLPRPCMAGTWNPCETLNKATANTKRTDRISFWVFCGERKEQI